MRNELMKYKGKKREEKSQELIKKIGELADDIREEYDMMELVEDSIKDIFKCDLDCSTCTPEDQGTCLGNFKKANLFWLRKIRQDEEILMNIVEKMDATRLLISELYSIVKKDLKKVQIDKEEDFIDEELKEEKIIDNNNHDIYT